MVSNRSGSTSPSLLRAAEETEQPHQVSSQDSPSQNICSNGSREVGDLDLSIGKPEEKVVLQRQVSREDISSSQISLGHVEDASPEDEVKKKPFLSPRVLYPVSASFEDKLRALLEDLASRIVVLGSASKNKQEKSSKKSSKQVDKELDKLTQDFDESKTEAENLGVALAGKGWKKTGTYYSTVGQLLLRYLKCDEGKYKDAIKGFFSEPKQQEEDLDFLESLEYCYALDSGLHLLPSGEPADYARAVELARKTIFLPLVWRLGKVALVPGQSLVSLSCLIPLLLNFYDLKGFTKGVLPSYTVSMNDLHFFDGISDTQTLACVSPEEKAAFSVMYPFLWSDGDTYPAAYGFLPAQEQKAMGVALLHIAMISQPAMVANRKIGKCTSRSKQSAAADLRIAAHQKIQDQIARLPLPVKKRERLYQDGMARYMKRVDKELSDISAKSAKSLVSEQCVNDLQAMISSERLDAYQRSVVRVLLAWMCNANLKRVGDRALYSATLLQKSAEEHFPLLYRDAAVLMARYGEYQQAVECMEAFLDRCSSASSDMGRLAAEELLWSYQERLADQKTLVEDTEENSVQSVSDIPGKAKVKKKKKKRKLQESKDGCPVETPSETVSSDVRVSAEPVPEIPDSRQEKSEVLAASSSVAIPAVHWLPDYDPDIRQFQRELEMARQEDRKSRFDSEEECLNSWLMKTKGTRAWARVCEEACWYYLYRSQITLAPDVCLAEDQQENVNGRRGMIKLASKWLAKAESGVMGFESTRQLPLDKFMARTEFLLQNIPSVSDPREYKKRLRALCSTRGHINSTLAELSSSGQGRKYGAVAHQFYTYADRIQPRAPKIASSLPEPKVHTISQEEMERRKAGAL